MRGNESLRLVRSPSAREWLGRSDGGSHGAELGRLTAGVLEARVGIGVYELTLLDLGVAPLDQQARVLAVEQRSGNSPGPEVDAFARVL